ncbi:conserved hypothetical protein [Ricinus communis]|uniref:Uncharacterized protein n=1 Tax=Ricinus communis TaxID=3988 RepID=B9SWK6_RICCO|nr:conserved hypothetical protein [Ricinus communis]
MTCGICKEPGHNIKCCPKRNVDTQGKKQKRQKVNSSQQKQKQVADSSKEYSSANILREFSQPRKNKEKELSSTSKFDPKGKEVDHSANPDRLFAQEPSAEEFSVTPDFFTASKYYMRHCSQPSPQMVVEAAEKQSYSQLGSRSTVKKG